MQRKLILNYTASEKVEIYLRSMLYGFSNCAGFGIMAAACGWFCGTVPASLYYSCSDPEAIESCFTSDGVIRASATTAAVAGLATMAFTFFPSVNWAINKGFEEGPRSIPLNPFA